MPRWNFWAYNREQIREVAASIPVSDLESVADELDQMGLEADRELSALAAIRPTGNVDIDDREDSQADDLLAILSATSEASELVRGRMGRRI